MVVRLLGHIAYSVQQFSKAYTLQFFGFMGTFFSCNMNWQTVVVIYQQQHQIKAKH